MHRYDVSTYFENLYILIMSAFPDITRSEASRIIRELILSPKEDNIIIKNEELTKISVVDYLSQFFDDSNQEDINYRYKKLLDNALNIIKHMNDGYITKEDFKERNALLDYITNKEFQLYFLIALLTEFIPDQINNQINNIIFKITQFRELNDLISKYTKDEFETETNKEEYEKAKVIYKILKSLQTLGYGYTLSQKEKENMGINHHNDDDLTTDFDYFSQIKRLTLLQIEREIERTISDSETLETIEGVFMEEIESNN